MKFNSLSRVIALLIASIAAPAALANNPESIVSVNSVTPGVSPEFAAVQASKVMMPELPTPTTTEGWLQLQKAFDAPGIELGKQLAEKSGVSYEKKEFAGVEVFFITPKNIAPEYKNKYLIHVHGGAFVLGGEESALRESVWVANGLGAQVISVDYRRPPLHPFPAAVDDVVAVWNEVIKTQAPENTAIFGTSAGGNLTLATVLSLRDQGLPVPGAIYAGTPATDLALVSETWLTFKGLDPLGDRDADGLIEGMFEVYAGEEDRTNPLISPVYGQFDDKFPPTLLFSGTRDLLLSDTVRVHRALRANGANAHLHIYDGQAHGDYALGMLSPFPESDDAMREIKEFFNEHINK
ncbi:alpha/beta hydrolase [Vibrio mexicanus]|uniref:alpha/beta hydrolase n=1 Tax=Vibrio mexicanus TaxID=1004326 RepID=UPI00063C1537|nr:alpha/beta hydrolase [Vibrio mexicanus]